MRFERSWTSPSWPVRFVAAVTTTERRRPTTGPVTMVLRAHDGARRRRLRAQGRTAPEQIAR
jgi:hypothetical protein